MHLRLFYIYGVGTKQDLSISHSAISAQASGVVGRWTRPNRLKSNGALVNVRVVITTGVTDNKQEKVRVLDPADTKHVPRRVKQTRSSVGPFFISANRAASKFNYV